MNPYFEYVWEKVDKNVGNLFLSIGMGIFFMLSCLNIGVGIYESIKKKRRLRKSKEEGKIIL